MKSEEENKKSPVKVIRRILIVLGIAYCIICIGVYFLQENLLFFPKQLADDHTYNFNSAFTEINIPAESGNVLNALLFTSDSTKGIVIYFHGNAGNLESWGSVSDDFISVKYNVLVFDYAGYGKSHGKMSEENLFKDAQSVYDYCRKKYSEDKIILYGRSIGTGIAAYVASKNHPAQLFLEAPYFSMVDLSSKLYPFLPSFILRYPLRTDLFLPKVKCPVTIFHGTEDEVIYPGSSVKLKPMLKNGDELFFIEGGHHNDLKNFESYHELLSQRLK
jgi:fermentation-respiration switch protein FrsA (DUF1100 family)